jgi:large subunit ribosomal protein L6
MSRIGKKPINIPAGVTVDVSAHNVVTVKGPKGTLTRDVNPDISVKVEDNQIVLERPTESKRHKSLHGLYRSLINNMVVGVSEGYKKELELVGVGYKASNQGQVLELSLGYSHNIFFALPDSIGLKTETPKREKTHWLPWKVSIRNWLVKLLLKSNHCVKLSLTKAKVYALLVKVLDVRLVKTATKK